MRNLQQEKQAQRKGNTGNAEAAGEIGKIREMSRIAGICHQHPFLAGDRVG